MDRDPLTPPPELISTLERMRRVVLVGHVTPDADCLGSMAALARSWPTNGNGRAVISLPDARVSSRLRFLLELAEPELAGADDFRGADGFVVTDTAQPSRCNIDHVIKADWPNGKPVVNIDHHASNTRFGNANWVAPAASACEMTFKILVTMDRKIDNVTASLLYAGMMTDTAGFSLSTTTPDTLRTASQLLSLGADAGLLGERLARSLSADEFNLLRLIYDNTRLTDDHRIAYSTADFEQIRAAGCDANDIDDQVAVPRSLRGVQIAMLLTEGRRGKVRINIRGENGTPVLDLARQLGGGGHHYAAGAIVKGTIDSAVELVLPIARRYLITHDAKITQDVAIVRPAVTR